MKTAAIIVSDAAESGVGREAEMERMRKRRGK